MVRKNNALGPVFKIAKEVEKQHRKAMREAEKQQAQKKMFQAKLEREIIKLQKIQEKEEMRRQIFEEKEKLNKEKQEMKIRMQQEKSLYNEMIESSISEENKEEIKRVKDIVNRFYLDWLQKINKIQKQ